MPMINPPQHHSPLSNAEPKPSFRQPHFDCTDLPHALELKVYVPGVDASGVEITTLGPDLGITARKPHHVRVNWPALHLERVQRDYQLKLRLGTGYDFGSLRVNSPTKCSRSGCRKGSPSPRASNSWRDPGDIRIGLARWRRGP